MISGSSMFSSDSILCGPGPTTDNLKVKVKVKATILASFFRINEFKTNERYVSTLHFAFNQLETRANIVQSATESVLNLIEFLCDK